MEAWADPPRITPMSQRFLADEAADEARVAARQALDAGRLVIVPTETVYGIAAREDRPEALAALAALKPGRIAPYSLAVADLERLAGRLAPLPRSARRVAARWWPGPVTQILTARPEVAARTGRSTLGVRIPGHPWLSGLLAAVDAPVLLPSANRPGQPPPTTLADIDPAVLAAAEVVVDAGRTALGDASTVWQPGRLFGRLHREGVVSRTDLLAHAAGRVLVVCSGNTCRSPMAAALIRAAGEAAARGRPDLIGPLVLSAGTGGASGQPASPSAMEAMDTRGLDLRQHSSRPLDADLLSGADLILCMTASHREVVAEALAGLGSADPPTVELMDPEGRDVDDPFGGPTAVYERCAADLETMVGQRVADWLSEFD